MHIYLYYSGVRTVRGLADRPDRGVSDPSPGGPFDHLRLQEVLQGVVACQSYLLLFPTNNAFSLYDDDRVFTGSELNFEAKTFS